MLPTILSKEKLTHFSFKVLDLILEGHFVDFQFVDLKSILFNVVLVGFDDDALNFQCGTCLSMRSS
jgi:hypothetical protein